MVSGGLCVKQMLLYSGFCATTYGEIYLKNTTDLGTNGCLATTQRTNATHSTKVLPNSKVWGSFFEFDSHFVHVVRFAVSDKQIIWLELWLLSSMGVPVQSDCPFLYDKKSPMLGKQNYRQLCILIVCVVLCKIANQGPKCPYKHKILFELWCLLFCSFGRDVCRCIRFPQQLNMS